MLAGTTVAREASGPEYGIYAYTAREWDPETNLYYYRARYYDPKIGRFISEDPIRFSGGANFYEYSGGSPVNRIDPLGLVWVSPEGADMCPNLTNQFGDPINSVCCRGGKMVPCLHERTKFLSSKVRSCIVEHERSYINDEPRCDCDLPRCVPIRASPGRRQSECKAWLASYECFKRSNEMAFQDTAVKWIWLYCFDIKITVFTP